MALRPEVRSALIAAVVCFIACAWVTQFLGIGAADFGWTVRAARDLLAGRDVYGHPAGEYAIPYPLPTAFVGLPVFFLPDNFAAAAFIGISTGLLVWGMGRANESWRLGMLFSWPFWYSVIFAQWAPLLCSIWFFPALAPFVLVKPNIAIPMVLTGRISKWHVLTTASILAVSLAIYPMWPLTWLAQIREYQGIRPPILVMPFGPLIALALLEWRSRRAWLLLTMACMPQRMFYDQLALLLVADNPKELRFLVMCTWAGFGAMWVSKGMAYMPGGWQLWIVLTAYLPPLYLVVRPHLITLAARYRPAAQES